MFLINRKYFTYFHLLIFILLYSIVLCGQEKVKPERQFPNPLFERFTVGDGLPDMGVTCITQDHLGFLWFGTRNGLVRYDGYKMKVYQHNPSDSHSMNGSFVISLFEDSSGDIWIGTANGGLNRFDRSKDIFTSYVHNSVDPASINANRVYSIFENEKGDLFVGTSKGLELFDPKINGFKHLYLKDSVYSKSVYDYISSLKAKGKTISSILNVGLGVNLIKTFEIKSKTVVLFIFAGEETYDEGWLKSTTGKLIIGPKNDYSVCAGGDILNRIRIVVDTLNKGKYHLHYRSYPDSWNQPILPADYHGFKGVQVIELPRNTNIQQILSNKKFTKQNYKVDDIIEDRVTKKLLVALNNKIMFYDSVKGFLSQKCTNLGDKNRLGRIYTFYQAADNIIWIAHSLGLAKFNSSLNTIKYYNPSGVLQNRDMDNVIKLTEDDNGFIWFFSGSYGGGNGLTCFDPELEKFKSYVPDYKHGPSSTFNVSSGSIMSIFKDRTGILWVGNLREGLNKWDSKKQKLNYYSFPYNLENEVFSPVYSIMEDRKGTIWLGGAYCLYSFNLSLNQFKYYGYKRSDNFTYAICEDSSGTIWIGTHTAGLGKFNPSDSTFKFYKKDPFDSTTINNNFVTFITPDKNDLLWVGTSGGGLNKFNINTGKFTHYLHNSQKPNSIRSNSVDYMYKNDSGKIWLVTGKGLDYFDPDNETFKPINIGNGINRNKESFKQSEILEDITSVNEDKNGNLWIGTYTHGLYFYNTKKDTIIYNITTQDGLSNNEIIAILIDDLGNVWASTGYGVSKFNPKTRSIKNYFTPYGVESNSYMSGSRFKSSTGEIMFGTYSNGFVIVNPPKIKDDPFTPQVVITNVSLFNQPEERLTLNKFVPELNELFLSYDQNDLRFDYVGLQFSEPEKNRYKYKLEGFDEDWIDAGTQRNAIYTNLNAGEYVFKVIACNADGVWNEKGASIKIIIPPPFWETWWAYSIYILFGISLLYGLRRYELNRTNLKNQVKLEKVKLIEREETDKMKSRFFANISHEFRTPLTLITGPIEKILSKHSDEETVKQGSVIKRNTNRLLGLINQLLDLSKLEAGKLKLKAAKGNIVPFIKGITMSFESAAERKDISLKVISSKEEIELYFDKDMMVKVLSNILSNAFKFTPEGGKITVSIEERSPSNVISRDPDFNRDEKSSNEKKKISPSGRNDNMKEFIEIKIKDTGIGISEEELPKLFDRFYQVDSSQTREYEGSGLGLALTKELVELHKGTIKVNSKLGEGSEFIIELPLGRVHLTNEEIVETEEIENPELVIDNEEHVPAVTNEEEKTESFNGEKDVILIVEDNKDVREYIKDSLIEFYQVAESENGEQGMIKAGQIVPDLIISDIMMPKMDGNELTKRIKNDERTSHIPVILLTAKAEQQSKLEGLETGADDYLIKPFDTQELLIRIRNLISIRKKLQAKFSGGKLIFKKHEKRISLLDEKFLNKAFEVVETHLDEEKFSIEQFSKEVGIGRVQLHRKLKALTGKSASLYIRSIRLSKAKDLIEEKKGNISEIAYTVGFSSPAYFTSCFKEEFGYPPSEFSH